MGALRKAFGMLHWQPIRKVILRPRYIIGFVLGAIFGSIPFLCQQLLPSLGSRLPKLLAVLWLLPGYLLGGVVSGGGFHCVDGWLLVIANLLGYGLVGMGIVFVMTRICSHPR